MCTSLFQITFANTQNIQSKICTPENKRENETFREHICEMKRHILMVQKIFGREKWPKAKMSVDTTNRNVARVRECEY